MFIFECHLTVNESHLKSHGGKLQGTICQVTVRSVCNNTKALIADWKQMPGTSWKWHLKSQRFFLHQLKPKHKTYFVRAVLRYNLSHSK